MEKIIFDTALTSTGYCAACELLPRWVVSGSADFDTFGRELREAVAFHLEALASDGAPVPRAFCGEWEAIYRFDVCTLLHHLQGTVSLAALERLTGINQRQLSHYAAARSHPRPAQAARILEGLHRLGRQLLAVTVADTATAAGSAPAAAHED